MTSSVLRFFINYLCLVQLVHGSIATQQEAAATLSPPFTRKVPHGDVCANQRNPPARSHTISIAEFGAVGDGVTLNTFAFHNAMLHITSFADKGGAELYVPAGKWLTGCFNLTSHLTLFLDKDAVILGSQNREQWPIIDALPSYGRGREMPGGRHASLIQGVNLTDVVITGDNGIIDGQGEVWWEWHKSGRLDYTRGHLIELKDSENVLISSLTFKDSPFWTIHPVYCSNVLIRNLTILAPIESPNTDGVNPDSSTNVCIEDCFIYNGDDLIAIKSGWDEYGIAYGRPSSNITIRHIAGGTFSSAGIALGSEMSGGISDVFVDDVTINQARTGILLKTARGRGAYVKDIYISNMKIVNVLAAFEFTAFFDEHPDSLYDVDALPDVERIVIENVVGENITIAGQFEGLETMPYRDICLKNIILNVRSSEVMWNCSCVQGYSESVYPEPCPELQNCSMDSVS